MELTGVPPMPPDLHDGYVALGLWDQAGLRDGVERHARRARARVALADATVSWTYEQLETRVARAVDGLAEHGITDGVPVLVIAPLIAEAVVAYHAIIRCGGIAVMLDRRCGQADVRHALDLVDAALIITTPGLAGRLDLAGAGRPVLSFDSLGHWPGRRRDWPEPDPRQPRVVVFTSGTTSRPKAVVHSLNTIRAGARSMASALEVPTLPLRAICLGGTMIPRPVLAYAIERSGITPVRVYGSSETPCATTTAPADRGDLRVADDGVPALGTELRIDGSRPGELLVRGPMRFLGYLDPADNRDAFVAGGWFRTGDLGAFDDGRVTVTGRVKEIVSRKGMKISLAEIDEAALALAGVQEAASYGVPDHETGERLVLAVRCSNPDDESFETIVSRLRSNGLATWKLPEQVVFWGRPLPRTASGKVLRSALAAGAGRQPTGLAPRLRPG